MDKSKIQIIVAAHKEFPMPDDEMYLPVQVGAAECESIRYTVGGVWCNKTLGSYARDDGGENISDRNNLYSELTGLYWAWKNLAAEYIGLVHYRRYFKEPHPQHETIGSLASEPLSSLKMELQWDNRPDTALETGAEVLQWTDITDVGYDALEKPYAKADSRILRQLGKVLSHESLELMLAETDIILPRLRNYRIETLYSHYAHTHCAEHLDVTRKIISERALSYLSTFDEVMQRRSAHMFNMMIMKRDKLDEYCGWLFPILEELAERIDTTGYDEYQSRFVGRVSELLLDVWLGKCGYAYRELPVVMIGQKHWGKKATAFLGAKFLGKRYEGSM